MDSIPDQVRAALLATDKFLAIFSNASLRSRWFESELRQALELEAERSTTVLIPIRVDNAVFSADGPLWVEMRDRLIVDFRDWRFENAYNKSFRQLALNLASSVSEDRASGNRMSATAKPRWSHWSPPPRGAIVVRKMRPDVIL
jgi:TIR domain-containing protein